MGAPRVGAADGSAAHSDFSAILGSRREREHILDALWWSNFAHSCVRCGGECECDDDDDGGARHTPTAAPNKASAAATTTARIAPTATTAVRRVQRALDALRAPAQRAAHFPPPPLPGSLTYAVLVNSTLPWEYAIAAAYGGDEAQSQTAQFLLRALRGRDADDRADDGRAGRDATAHRVPCTSRRGRAPPRLLALCMERACDQLVLTTHGARSASDGARFDDDDDDDNNRGSGDASGSDECDSKRSCKLAARAQRRRPGQRGAERPARLHRATPRGTVGAASARARRSSPIDTPQRVHTQSHADGAAAPFAAYSPTAGPASVSSSWCSRMSAHASSSSPPSTYTASLNASRAAPPPSLSPSLLSAPALGEDGAACRRSRASQFRQCRHGRDNDCRNCRWCQRTAVTSARDRVDSESGNDGHDNDDGGDTNGTNGVNYKSPRADHHKHRRDRNGHAQRYRHSRRRRPGRVTPLSSSSPPVPSSSSSPSYSSPSSSPSYSPPLSSASLRQEGSPTRPPRPSLTSTPPPPLAHALLVRLIADRRLTLHSLSLFARLEVPTLSLDGCHAAVTDDWLSVIGTLRGLRALELRNCRRITDSGVFELALDPHSVRQPSAASQSLCALDLSGCTQISNDAVDALVYFPYLDELHVDECDRLNNVALARIGGKLGRAARLVSVSGCTDIGAAGVAHLMRDGSGNVGGGGGSGSRDDDDHSSGGADNSNIAGGAGGAGGIGIGGDSAGGITATDAVMLPDTNNGGRVRPAEHAASPSPPTPPPTLTLLDLSHCPNIGAHALRSLACAGASLRALRLRSCGRINDAACHLIAASLPNLEHLELYGCQRVGDDGVRALATRLPRLRSLCLAESQVTDAALPDLGAMPALERVHLPRCARLQLSDDAVEAFVRRTAAHGRLRELRIRSVPGVSARVMAAMARGGMFARHTPLRCLNVAGCRAFDASALACVAAHAGEARLRELRLRGTRIADLALHTTCGTGGGGDDDIARASHAGMAAAVPPPPPPPPPTYAPTSPRNTLATGAYLRRVQRLELAACEHLTEGALTELAAFIARGGMPHLTHLDVSECDAVTFESLRPLASASLRVLNVDHCANVTNACAASIARRLPMLQEFSARFTAISDAGVAALRHAPYLEVLNVRGLQGVTHAGLARLADARHACRRLRVLDLAACKNVGAESLAALAHFSRLHFLDLKWCTEVDDDGVRAHLVRLQRLEKLNVRGCRVSEVGRAMLQQCLPVLAHLKADNDGEQVSEAAVVTAARLLHASSPSSSRTLGAAAAAAAAWETENNACDGGQSVRRRRNGGDGKAHGDGADDTATCEQLATAGLAPPTSPRAPVSQLQQQFDVAALSAADAAAFIQTG